MRLSIEDQVLIGLVATLGVHCLLPRLRIIKAIGADTGRNIIMVDFAHAPGPPAITHKGLGKSHRLGHLIAKVTIQIINLDGVGP